MRPRTPARASASRTACRPGDMKASGRVSARCTCGEAVRFPDERSEELSRSESRKRVRDFCADCGRRDFCSDPVR